MRGRRRQHPATRGGRRTDVFRNTPAHTPGFPQAPDGTDVRACHDGSCEILVTKRTRIPLDSRFGFRTFSFDTLHPGK
ncbi:hypothetical protein [Actinoallomurus iriomotensis]|uniref:Uncharacterized protein n=1 Tax=Actinoallomurus iriomotensis TaxID=478107 RepID=A0A9W6VYQ9_9ACTN|nr:hypothetical protein [Actinoallomurus iriomotensis]GLY83076.1 hypothetical protein Airi02_010060 [Actinoallomurus iriomotensis]